MTPTPEQPARDGARHLPPGRMLSLDRKLPLLMTGVLVAILAASLFLTYGTLIRSGESAARERLARAARQAAGSAEGAMSQRAAALRALAGDQALRRALALAERDSAAVWPDTAAAGSGVGARSGGAAGAGEELALARAALARVLSPGDSGLALELWDARGRRVTYVGADVPAAERTAVFRPPGRARADSVVFGPTYAAAGRVLFWVVAPVVASGRTLGFVAQQRRVTGPRGAPQMLRELTGQDVSLYLRDARSGVWASAPGVPAAPHLRVDSGPDGLIAMRPGAGRMITEEAAVRGTPYVFVLEAPVGSVRSGARETLITLAILSLILTAVGAVVSWEISRRITSPLASLSGAAEAIARGEYARRVAVTRGDEIGRLAASFNQMATEVAGSREELERRIADTQAGAAALERANTQLHRAIGEAEQARAEAERANRAKSDFLAVMSHELRTPLNAIGGYAQLLEMEVYGPLTEAQRDALTRLTRSQAHLLGLITNVLNFAKIDAGQVEYAIDDVALGEMLVAVEPMVAPQLHAKGIAYAARVCDSQLTALADREKLQQIVLNLVTNAIKFTPPGGSVTVECDVAGGATRLRVRDTGVGIPPERLASIFDPFVQGERALNRPNEGVGLGLAISRDLARGMGGDIAVESAVGAGSTFTLMLPRQAAGAVGAPALPEAARGETQAV